MKNYLINVLLIPVFLFLISCGTEDKKQEKEVSVMDPGAEKEQSAPVTFEPYEVEKFPDAIIEMYSPLGNENFEAGKIPFEFNIKNFPFEQEPRSFRLRLTINCDNPISYNMPVFQREFEKGTYRAVAYLIDQQGIALKEFGNYVERDFTVADSKPFPVWDEPYMVVNLPEDGQTYQNGEEVILDILLIGGGLKEDQLKYLVSIDGHDKEIKEAGPIKVKNLPPGSYDLKVKLVQEDGEELKGIFTSEQRKIKVN